MKLNTSGIVVDQFGQILLIQRNDTRTLAPPGGALESGELPPDSAAREVKEETGLIVKPVRLVGLYFWPLGPEGYLNFSFRCLPQGGKLTPSRESPRVGFSPTNPLPRIILPLHRERIQRGLSHAGGPPYWGEQKATILTRLGKTLLFHLIYRLMDWWRFLRRQPAYQPPPDWRLGAHVVTCNRQGQVLWIKPHRQDVWMLPGGAAVTMEPPWQTAVRTTRQQTGLTTRLTDLSGVYVTRGEDDIFFIFTAEMADSELTVGPETAEFAYITPGEEPANALPQHVAHVADACSRVEETIFRFQQKTTTKPPPTEYHLPG
jgi:ADP-ribose pyrophosphatase YjhB (NUDIX family)